MNATDRWMLAALAWVDQQESTGRRDNTWAVLVTVLRLMIRRNTIAVKATDGFISRATGLTRKTVGDTMRRMMAAGVLVDETDTDVG